MCDCINKNNSLAIFPRNSSIPKYHHQNIITVFLATRKIKQIKLIHPSTHNLLKYNID